MHSRTCVKSQQERGNAAFGRKDYSAAVRAYSVAIRLEKDAEAQGVS